MLQNITIRLAGTVAALGLIALACADDSPTAPPKFSDNLVKIAMIAEVTDVSDSQNFLGGAIKPGDRIQGTYIYDATTPDGSASPNVGSYRHDKAPYGWTMTAGGFVFQTDPDNVDFLMEYDNDLFQPTTYDIYLLRSYNNLNLNDSLEVEHMSWQLNDRTHTAHDSDSLTTLPPVLTDFQDGNNLNIECFHPGQRESFDIQARVTAVNRVP